MRIVNQSRNRSIEISLYDIFCDENRLYAEGNGKTRLLGTYATEERAKEVFDAIHEKYLECEGTIAMPRM